MSDRNLRILEKTYLVTGQETIQLVGPEAVPILSTPSLVRWMELTARDNAAPLLSAGEDTVGATVHIKHLAATPIGARVKVISRLTHVEGRIYHFEVEAFDEVERIGEATHRRASVNVARFTGRITAKIRKLSGSE